MVYIILDIESGNYEGTYPSEAEALADVRDAVTRFGRATARIWALARREDDGALTAIAASDALIERALGTDHVGRAVSA